MSTSEGDNGTGINRMYGRRGAYSEKGIVQCLRDLKWEAIQETVHSNIISRAIGHTIVEWGVFVRYY